MFASPIEVNVQVMQRISRKKQEVSSHLVSGLACKLRIADTRRAQLRVFMIMLTAAELRNVTKRNRNTK